jgi:hypothetical protein
MSDEDEYGKCDICEEEGILKTTQFVFDLVCSCCEPNHFEEVKHCPSCVPELPEFMSYISTSGVQMINIESKLLTYTHGN